MVDSIKTTVHWTISQWLKVLFMIFVSFEHIKFPLFLLDCIYLKEKGLFIVNNPSSLFFVLRLKAVYFKLHLTQTIFNSSWQFELRDGNCTLGIKPATNLEMTVLFKKNFRRTDACGFHYSVYAGCYIYPITTVLNNYRISSSSWAQTFFQKG